MTDKTELIELLRTIDEITLLELLQVTADDLVDAFLDRIHENEGKLVKYVRENA